jgi:uncharacterized protein YkwD
VSVHKQFLILILISLFRTSDVFSQASPVATKVIPEICLSETEEMIFRKVNEYRTMYGLKAVQLSKSLTYVAQLHVYDLAVNHPTTRRCNLHSWSSNGPWSSCCYTEDHRAAECMWNKPRELTNYSGDGYEIAYWTNERLYPSQFAEKALLGWKRSSDHNRVIMNKGEWKKLEWNAMGVGYYEGFAVVWFGILSDARQEIHLCVN